MDTETPLQRAVRIANGQAPLAREASRHHPTGKRLRQGQVWKWLNAAGASAGALITPEWVIPIAKGLHFKVTPHELRPDLYPDPCDGLPAELRAA